MRDHPNHDIEILGGLWGMKMTPKMRLLMNKTFETIFTTSPSFYGSRTQSNHDQILLRSYIWYVEVLFNLHQNIIIYFLQACCER